MVFLDANADIDADLERQGTNLPSTTLHVPPMTHQSPGRVPMTPRHLRSASVDSSPERHSDFDGNVDIDPSAQIVVRTIDKSKTVPWVVGALVVHCANMQY